MTKKELARLYKLHTKGSWTHEELNELSGLYKDYYVWAETNKIMPTRQEPPKPTPAGIRNITEGDDKSNDLAGQTK